MRKFIATMSCLVLVLMSAVLSPMNVSADISETPPIAITLIVPTREVNQIASTSQLNPYHVYPVHVWENREYGRRQIIRVYELAEHENPAHIPRLPFERDGFRFELAEIVRREIPSHNMRQHSETITVNTQTNDLASVIALLSPTIDHISEDGYFGVLSLDISSIQIQSQGTTSSNFTATRTREFPHLSSPDTSLVPRTISEGGRTYNLAGVDWQTQSTSPVDYRQVESTFTAVATYTRAGTRTSTIGYTTTAVYSGQISRISTGRTEFTAFFLGIPIATPFYTADPAPAEMETTASYIPEYTAETQTLLPAHMTVENVIVETVQVGGMVIEMEHAASPEFSEPETEATAYELNEAEYEPEESGGLPIGSIALALMFALCVTVAYFIGKNGKAMLNKTKKITCLLLFLGILFSVPHVAYAANIPRYGFGARNSGAATHFNEHRPNTQAGGMPSQNNGTSIHFNPRSINYSNSPTVSSNVLNSAGHFNMGHAHNYNYGDNIGRLTVERLGRNIRVIAGATMSAMDFGAGHFSFTGINTGNTGLVGHNRGSNGFFSFVRTLREGDILRLEAGGTTRRYVVTTVFTVNETDFSPLMEFGDCRLTLVTCVEYQRSLRRIAVAIAID